MMRTFAGVLCALSLFGLSPASAQQANEALEVETESAADEARTTFNEGRALLEEGRFVEAKEVLGRSFELAPRMQTAFNLAVALAGVGESMESVELLDRLLAGEFGEISDDIRSAAEDRRTLFARTIAHLTLQTEPAAAALRLDGELTARARMHNLNPGVHILDLSAADYLDHQQRVDLQPGETRALELSLELAPPPEVEIRQRSIARSPWFWILTGVVLAGGATALALVLTSGGDRPENIDLRVNALQPRF